MLRTVVVYVATANAAVATYFAAMLTWEATTGNALVTFLACVVAIFLVFHVWAPLINRLEK